MPRSAAGQGRKSDSNLGSNGKSGGPLFLGNEVDCFSISVSQPIWLGRLEGGLYLRIKAPQC